MFNPSTLIDCTGHQKCVFSHILARLYARPKVLLLLQLLILSFFPFRFMQVFGIESIVGKKLNQLIFDLLQLVDKFVLLPFLSLFLSGRQYNRGILNRGAGALLCVAC